MRSLMMVGALLLVLPMAAQAQYYPPTPYSPNGMVIVPPAYPTGPGATMPFPSPQAGQQRMLEMLQNGGLERPDPARAEPPRGCTFAGQLYSEGAVVKSEIGLQVCDETNAVPPNARGQRPLRWRVVPGG